MKKLLLAVMLFIAWSATSPLAADRNSHHRVTANVGLFSEYVFRGLAQTNGGPALQGGFDYSYTPGPVTFYAGTWGSNVSLLRDSGLYLHSSLELDFYGGVRGKLGRTRFSWDVGYLYYWYPGDAAPSATNANSHEVYGGLGWSWITGKFSCSVGSETFTVRDTRGTYYLDLSASPTLGETGLSLLAHYGFQRFTGADPALAGRADNDAYYSYEDWKVGLHFDLGRLTSALKGTNVGSYGAGTRGADPCAYGSTAEACKYGGAGAYPRNIAASKFVVYLQFTR